MCSSRTGPRPEWRLVAVKAIHTLVWAFFVVCILAIWAFAWRADFIKAALATGLVLIEVVVLAINRWRCPLSPIARAG